MVGVTEVLLHETRICNKWHACDTGVLHCVDRRKWPHQLKHLKPIAIINIVHIYIVLTAM